MQITVQDLKGTVWEAGTLRRVTIKIPTQSARYDQLVANSWKPRIVKGNVVVTHKTTKPDAFISVITNNFLN
jgi:hypothetical protein